MSNSNLISISVVDDHQLFREGLIQLIHRLDPEFKVISESQNGSLFLQEVEAGLCPDLVILDLNMPVMDGFNTVQELQKQHPHLKALVLTMKVDDITLIRLLKAGACGFLNKDAEPEELKQAIRSIHLTGNYFPSALTGKLIDALQNPKTYTPQQNKLNEQELKFLELACSEYTYKEIADKMCLSIKTVDGYRASLFEKLNVKSRVGLVLFAIKNKVVAVG